MMMIVFQLRQKIFQSWYDGEQVGIEFFADGVTKVINKEDFRDFCKFVSQTHDEFILAEDADNGERRLR